jgi:hypothetical protein
MMQATTWLWELSEQKHSIYKIVCGLATHWSGVPVGVASITAGVLGVVGIILQSHKSTQREVALIAGLLVIGLLLGVVGSLKIIGM